MESSLEKSVYEISGAVQLQSGEKNHPLGTLLYSISTAVVVVQYTRESSKSYFCYELLG